ncbi:PAS domain S-box protein [Leptothrix discophora]|uniref:PAS domain S-box protein n=1 Tax=Leptothrix discophora TaxID=89 RepID=A0ABT9G0F4_LEPDI|nr:PAS domain S-box protein [Leptothrix discophora]MDP4299965.1 PAS domain S-box protein [Leptothrix discophora]
MTSPWRKALRLPLRVSLPLAVALMLLATAGSSLWSARTSSVDRLAQTARHQMHTEMHRLVRLDSDVDEPGSASALSSTGSAGQTLDIDRVWREISHLMTFPLVREVAVIDADGRIRHAHRRSWIGRQAADTIPDWDPAWMNASLATRLPQMHVGADGTRLTGLQSYLGRTVDLRQPRQLASSVVYLRMELAGALDDLALREVRERSPELLAQLALILVVAALIQLGLARPLGRLQAISQRWARGDLSLHAPETGPAEVAELAVAFNHMVDTLRQHRDDLLASEDRLSTVLYSTGDALLATDAQQRITLLNPAAEALTGWREYEACGRPVGEVFRIEHAQTGAPAEIPVQRVLETGLVVGLANHTVLVSRQGRRTHIADSAAPLRNGRGELRGVVIVFRDVTESYRLEQALAESELHYRALANAGHSLILTTDANGRSVWCNQPWLAWTGQAEEALGETDWLSLVHPEDLDAAWMDWRRAIAQPGSFEQNLRLRRLDGSHAWVLVKAVPRRSADGRFQGHVLQAIDASREREADQRMASQLDELRRWQAGVIDREERVAELKAEVNELRTRLGLPPRYRAGEATTISDPAAARAPGPADASGSPSAPTHPTDPDTPT